VLVASCLKLSIIIILLLLDKLSRESHNIMLIKQPATNNQQPATSNQQLELIFPNLEL
jgi:hypothetical protein